MHDSDDPGAGQHAQFDRLEGHVGEQGGQLSAQQLSVDRREGVDFVAVLDGERADQGQGMAPHGVQGLDVGGQSGSSARVETCDDQNTRRHDGSEGFEFDEHDDGDQEQDWNFIEPTKKDVTMLTTSGGEIDAYATTEQMVC